MKHDDTLRWSVCLKISFAEIVVTQSNSPSLCCFLIKLLWKSFISFSLKIKSRTLKHWEPLDQLIFKTVSLDDRKLKNPNFYLKMKERTSEFREQRSPSCWVVKHVNETQTAGCSAFTLCTLSVCLRPSLKRSCSGRGSDPSQVCSLVSTCRNHGGQLHRLHLLQLDGFQNSTKELKRWSKSRKEWVTVQWNWQLQKHQFLPF